MIYLCFTDTLLLLYARVIMLYSCFTHDLLVLYSCFKERVGVVGVFLVLYSSLLMLYSYSTRAEQIFFTRFFSLIDYSKTLLYSHGRLPGALQIFRLFFLLFFPLYSCFCSLLTMEKHYFTRDERLFRAV